MPHINIKICDIILYKKQKKFSLHIKKFKKLSSDIIQLIVKYTSNVSLEEYFDETSTKFEDLDTEPMSREEEEELVTRIESRQYFIKNLPPVTYTVRSIDGISRIFSNA